MNIDIIHTKKRFLWLDIAKGIAIILMVVGHTSIPSFLSRFIWSFHMPLFFIASGYTTKWGGYFSDFTANKAKRLLLPFLCYSVIVLFIQILLDLNTFSSFIRNGWISYALWFIPVLFLASMCARLIYCINQSKLRLCLLGLCLTLGWALCYYKVYLPWTLASVPYATFLIVVGKELKGYQRHLEPNLWKIALLFILTFTISHFWHLDICFNNILPIIPITIGAIFGTLLIFMISMVIENKSKYLTRVLTSIGRETFFIVAFSQIVIVLFNIYVRSNMFVKYIGLVLILVVGILLKNWVKQAFAKHSL